MKNSERNDINVGWRFSEKFCNRIKKIATKKGLRVNSMVRMVLTEWMEEEERNAKARKVKHVEGDS